MGIILFVYNTDICATTYRFKKNNTSGEVRCNAQNRVGLQSKGGAGKNKQYNDF